MQDMNHTEDGGTHGVCVSNVQFHPMTHRPLMPDESIHADAPPECKWQKILGGGSWYYFMRDGDGKVYGAIRNE